MSNLKVWTDGLRSTKTKQMTNQLGAVIDGETKMCCLGFGCTLVPELEPRITWQEPEEDSDDQRTNMIVDLSNGEWSDSMPALDFHEWLGATVQGGVFSGDVLPDWPRVARGLIGVEWCDRDGIPYRASLTCAKLNDGAGLTFAQIADVLDYLGVV